MNRTIILLAVGVLVALAAVACDGAGDVDEPRDGPTGEELVARGQDLYGAFCATCHRDDGAGRPGIPSLRDSALVVSEDAGSVARVVLHGRDEMPAFQGRLDDEQIAAIVSYVRNAWGHEASTVTPQEVAALR